MWNILQSIYIDCNIQYYRRVKYFLPLYSVKLNSCFLGQKITGSAYGVPKNCFTTYYTMSHCYSSLNCHIGNGHGQLKLSSFVLDLEQLYLWRFIRLSPNLLQLFCSASALTLYHMGTVIFHLPNSCKAEYLVSFYFSALFSACG